MSFFVLCTFALYIVFQGGQLPSLATADYLEVKSLDDGYIPLDNVIMDENDQLAGRFKYVIKPGDTLIGIAQEFGITTKQIIKTNNLKSEKIIPGQEIIISEVDGIVYEIPGDISLKDFASKYGIDKEDIKQLNFIQNDNDVLKKDNQLFLSLTVEEAQTVGLIKKDEPIETIRPARTQSKHPKAKNNVSSKPTSNQTQTTKPKVKTTNMWRFVKKVKDGFGFVPGHCTRYAAQKRPDIFVPGQTRPFGGNGKARGRNAKAAGYSVGKTPRIGSVAVMPVGRGGYGHVGIVVDIDDDGVLIESMNYRGRYIVSRDWVDSGQISSYIY